MLQGVSLIEHSKHFSIFQGVLTILHNRGQILKRIFETYLILPLFFSVCVGNISLCVRVCVSRFQQVLLQQLMSQPEIALQKLLKILTTFSTFLLPPLPYDQYRLPPAPGVFTVLHLSQFPHSAYIRAHKWMGFRLQNATAISNKFLSFFFF